MIAAAGVVVALAALACQSPAPSSAPAAAGSAAAGSAAAAAALRLISLTPSATEVVAALDATALLIGVDDYSAFPPEVAKLPKVGSFLAPNLEIIVGLKPSLVIVDDVHSQVAGALHDAGIASVACAIHDLPDIKSALATVGAQIGRAAQAQHAVDAIDAALDHAAAQRPAQRPRVLAVIDRESDGLGNMVAAGPGSWIDELLAVVGGANVLAGAGTRYPKISAEEVIRTKPDVILDLSFAARQSLAPWQALKVPAVAANRVRALQDAYLIAPSPRVADALAALARAIN